MNIEVFRYNDGYEAERIYGGFSMAVKLTMADIYREAFGGYPWFERYLCALCGRFLKTTECDLCKQTTTQEAYPVKTLIEEDFPEMMSSFVPGMLGLVFDDRKLIGYTTGGFIDLDELIEKKYKSNTIYYSVIEQFGLNGQEDVFYDNETCIYPQIQQRGVGTKLSYTRIKVAIGMNADLICGRSINKPWLNIKESQFTAEGYNFSRFVPNGDTYEVDGNPRYFYLAQKK